MLKLSHNDCIQNVFQSLAEFWKQKKFCDLRVSCEDGSMDCSRLILASSSPYLHQILASEPVDQILLVDTSIQHLRELLVILHGGVPDIKTDQFSSHVKIIIQSLQINIFTDFDKSCINNSKSIDNAAIDDTRNKVKNDAIEITKEVIDAAKDMANEADNPTNIVKDDATDIRDTFDTFFKAVEIQSRTRPREKNKYENDFDKPSKKSKLKLEACTGKKFTKSIENKSNHEDKKIVFKDIDVFIKDQVGILKSTPRAGYNCHLCGHNDPELYPMEKHLNGHGLTREKDKLDHARYKLVTAGDSDVPILEERFRPFSCEFCHRLIGTEKEGIKHQEYCGTKNVWYTILSNNKFQCKLCRSILKRKILLKNHLAFVHSESLPFACDECKESFVTCSLLKDHKFEHKSSKGAKGRTSSLEYHLSKRSIHLPEGDIDFVLSSYSTPKEDLNQCKICLDSFSPDEMNTHLLTNHLKLTFFECVICRVRFSQLNQLEEHKKRNHLQEIVDSALTVVEKDKPDSERVHEKDDLKEEENNDNINRLNESDEELIDKDPDEYLCKSENKDSYVCNLCDQEGLFNNISDARSHVNKHFENPFNSCDMCDKLFCSEDDLRTHMCIQEDGEKLIGNYHNIQGTVFIPWTKARSIVDSYLTKMSNGFHCILCAFSRQKLSKMRRHVLLHHLKMYVYQCEECYEEFKFQSDYENHLSSAHGKYKKDFNSSPSIKVISEQELLNKPLSIGESQKKDLKMKDMYIKPGSATLSQNKELKLDYHLLDKDLFVGEENGKKIVKEYYFRVKGRTFECKLCSFSSASQGVEYHIFAKHLNHLILYSCDICGKQFRYSKKSLNSHILEHTVGKLHCQLCHTLGLNMEKKFTSESLVAHNKRFHTKERDYVCEEPGCQGDF